MLAQKKMRKIIRDGEDDAEDEEKLLLQAVEVSDDEKKR